MRKPTSALPPEIAHSQALSECPLSAKNRHGEPAERCQLKPLNVGACHDGIAGRSGRDPDHVDFVRYSAVRMFPHVCHHRGDRLAYLTDPEKRARALLAIVSPSITSRTRGRFPLATGRHFSRKRATKVPVEAKELGNAPRWRVLRVNRSASVRGGLGSMRMERER